MDPLLQNSTGLVGIPAGVSWGKISFHPLTNNGTLIAGEQNVFRCTKRTLSSNLYAGSPGAAAKPFTICATSLLAAVCAGGRALNALR